MDVRERAQLDALDGLIIPGGESTTMLKLLHYENLIEPLREFGRRKPVFGTCAGAILLAQEVTNPAQESLGLMDIGVERNAYGRQVDSRVVELDAGAGISNSARRRANWRRSSSARRSSGASGPGVKVLASMRAIRCWWSRAGTWWRRSIRN